MSIQILSLSDQTRTVDGFRRAMTDAVTIRLQAAREDADDLWRRDMARYLLPLHSGQQEAEDRRTRARERDLERVGMRLQPGYRLRRERILHALPAALRAGVGQVEVNPYYRGGVGNTQINPYNPGVGAPVEQVPPATAPPVQVNQPAWQSGGNSLLGLGYRIMTAATNVATLQTLFDTRGTLSFNVKPFRPFNPGFLWSPSTTIDTLVDQIKIQGIEVFSGDEVTPIEIFSEVSRIREMQWLTIQEASGVTSSTSNPTADDQLFKGAFWGSYVRQ